MKRSGSRRRGRGSVAEDVGPVAARVDLSETNVSFEIYVPLKVSGARDYEAGGCARGRS